MVRSKRDDENYQEYTDRVLNSKSASFCGAKWYNATIWLGSGQTTSCHHPLPHAIDLEEIKTNPSAIHNTREKKLQREQMQKGIRPRGCEYCWRLEDAGTTSDRPHKSAIFSEQELQTAFETPSSQDVNLRTLEIAFDRTCQFACSYCNPAFSSTWAKDIMPEAYAWKLQMVVNWMQEHLETADRPFQGFKDYEIQRLQRVVDWMRENNREDKGAQADFYRFFTEHDRRRGTDFEETFPEMAKWWAECKYWADSSTL
jgi:hypothetical protein